jgi:hypothetical protein
MPRDFHRVEKMCIFHVTQFEIAAITREFIKIKENDEISDKNIPEKKISDLPRRAHFLSIRAGSLHIGNIFI